MTPDQEMQLREAAVDACEIETSVRSRYPMRTIKERAQLVGWDDRDFEVANGLKVKGWGEGLLGYGTDHE